MGVGRGRGVDVPGVGEEAKRGVRASGQALERRTELFSHHSHSSSIWHNDRRDTFCGHEFSNQSRHNVKLTVSFYVKGRIDCLLVMPYVAAHTLNLALQICGSHRHIHGGDSLQVKPEMASYYNYNYVLSATIPQEKTLGHR